jgi:hypothetical protein
VADRSGKAAASPFFLAENIRQRADMSIQVIFLTFGDRFVRLHDVTEYKEFLIPVARLLYSFDVLSRVLKSTSSPVSWV